METLIQIAINSIAVMAVVTIVAGGLTLAGHALASNAVEDEPDGH